MSHAQGKGAQAPRASEAAPRSSLATPQNAGPNESNWYGKTYKERFVLLAGRGSCNIGSTYCQIYQRQPDLFRATHLFAGCRIYGFLIVGC